MRLIACVTACLVPVLADAAQMAPQLRPTVKRIVLIAVRTFIPIRVSPAKAAINSDRAIAGVLKAGTTLVRQWRGHTHTVLVHTDGFEHEGQLYRSLTAIAERITEAHWSGPRFFGLTKRARALAGAKTGR